MTTLPALTGKKVVKALKNAGFVVIRIRSSHHFMRPQMGERRLFPYTREKPLGQA